MTENGDQPDPDSLTRALRVLAKGDVPADPTLVANLLETLRKIASGHLRSKRSKQAFEPTALVHEAYLRLFGGSGAGKWKDRGHFFRVASAAMRTILVDYARSRRAQKRPPESKRIDFDKAIADFEDNSTDLLDIEDALSNLEKKDRRAAEVFEMRYFGGRTSAEIAEALGVVERTVNRDLEFVRAYIRRELLDGDEFEADGSTA